MSKSIIYYTDGHVDEPICSIVRRYLLESGLPITSVSLRPIDFGNNIVITGERSPLTMFREIVVALENSTEDYVFFCEHDVLYPKCHFDFIPFKDNIFYYNDNVWRWDYPKDRIVTYEGLHCVSELCASRKLALEHYRMRVKTITEENITDRQIWNKGYEPGTRKLAKRGWSDDEHETWHSEIPVVDIRHDKNFSIRRVTMGAFRHRPDNWQEKKLNQIPGWNLRGAFNLYEIK